MKSCTACKQEKPVEEFPKRSASQDGLASRCKPCKRDYDNAHYKANPQRRLSIAESAARRRLAMKQFVRDYLNSHPCIDCGQQDADLLEFDHVRGEKKYGISLIIGSPLSMQSLLDEIDKCVVRCLYCHRKRTIKQLGWYAWVEAGLD